LDATEVAKIGSIDVTASWSDVPGTGMSGSGTGNEGSDGLQNASKTGTKAAGKVAKKAGKAAKKKVLQKLGAKTVAGAIGFKGFVIILVVIIILSVIVAVVGIATGASAQSTNDARFFSQQQIIAAQTYDLEAPADLQDPIGDSQLNAIQRASTCNANLPWILVAAIASVQSDFGRTLDRSYGPVDATSEVLYGTYIGNLTPAYESAPMDGTGVMASAPSATATLDDGTVVPDRLVGPLQLRLSYFQTYGVRSPEAGLGRRDPQNIYDQIATISNQFCQVTRANTGDPFSPNIQEQADELDLRVGLQRFMSEARIFGVICTPAEGQPPCPTNAFPTTFTAYYSQVINKAAEYGLDIRAFGLQQLNYSGAMGLPVELFAAYTAVSQDTGLIAACPTVTGVRWSLLASIGYFETRWARSLATSPDTPLTFDPATGDMLGDPIYSMAGNPGYPRRNLTPAQQARFVHTDADFARWNVTNRPDTQHAVGLMQFMPPSFEANAYRSPMAQPAGAQPSITNVYDQIWSAALLLCRVGAGDPARGEVEALSRYTGFPVGDPRSQERIDFANLLEQQALESEGAGTDFIGSPMTGGGTDPLSGTFNRGLPSTCNGRIHNTPGCQQGIGMVDVNGCTLRADAATSFRMLVDAAARDGFIVSSRSSDCYRTYESQVYASQNNPNAARIPGTSNHGWGYAVDMNIRGPNGRPQGLGFTSPFFLWLQANGARFGWYLPGWAQQNGSKPEAWHWQYGGFATLA
jgi:hypothetical protein